MVEEKEAVRNIERFHLFPTALILVRNRYFGLFIEEFV
jgi:hypothetical protein